MTRLRAAQIHDTGQIGTVYLLHFDTPYHHAKHYVGFTKRRLGIRLGEHCRGNGSALTTAATAAGITMRLARAWYNVDQAREKTIKCRGETPRLCPICNPLSAGRLATTYGETKCYTNPS